MAQITLNSSGVASNGSLVLQSNGTTAAVTIDTSQRAAFVAGTAALPAITTTGDTNTGIFFPAADTIAFSEGGAEAMRIDSSGNLGLGVTPSAWFATSRILQIGSGGAIESRTNFNPYISTTSNAYLDTAGTYRYIGSAEAGRYLQSSGVHSWYTAASGTAGNAITLTQAMTLDASGHLLVGATSSAGVGASRLQVGSTGSAATQALVQSATTHVGFYASSAAESYISYAVGSALILGNGPANGSTFTEAARIDSSGNVGIGTTSPTVALDVFRTAYPEIRTRSASYTNTFGVDTVNGFGVVGSVTNNAFTFVTNNTERARIDSSGNLLVGTTSTVAGAAFVVSKSVNDYLARFINSNATAYGVVVNYSGASPNSTGQEFLRCVDSTADRMLVRSNGGIANYSANDVNLSDRREKTNFAPAKSYLDVICAIPVQTFNYIDQNMEDDGGLTLGVVAQDVQAVAPELVMESNWASKDEEPKMRLSIYQTDLQYALMKCIQEQQAIITQLTARITALEGA